MVGGMGWMVRAVPVFEVVTIMQLGRDMVRPPRWLNGKKGKELRICDGVNIDGEGGESHIMLRRLRCEQIPISNVIDLLDLVEPVAGCAHAEGSTAAHYHRCRGEW